MYRHTVGVLAVVLCSVFLLTGCFDQLELEEQAFLVSMGIDQAKRNAPVIVMARVAVPSKLSGSSGSSGGGSGAGDFQNGTPVVSTAGRTIHEALELMNTGVEREINLSHVSGILFSEKAAKLGLLSYLRSLVRYREFRRTLYLFVAKGKLSDVFLKNRPVLETSATRLIEDLHQSSQRTGYAPSIELHQFMGGLESPNEDPILPVLSVNQQVVKEKKGNAGDPDHLKGERINYQPGKVNRSGGNPVECVGTAVFLHDRMVGILSAEETRFLQLLGGASNRVVMTVNAPIGPRGFITLGVRYAEPFKIEISPLNKHNAPPTVSVTQSFEVELLGDQTSTSYVTDHNREILQKALSARIHDQEKLLIHKLFTKYHADPFHFFEYARGQFGSYSEMAAYDWHKQLAHVKVAIHIETVLRRLGTQMSPPVTQENGGSKA